MNLNAYISLMGHTWHKETTADGVVLRKVADGVAPDDGRRGHGRPGHDYLLTLDADSLLLRDYCLRLVYFLESAGNERVAVTQTPYSSFRGAPTRIERVAGATTDLQHILHQGMTYYGATFWVGANAVIRKRALEDIVEMEYHRRLRDPDLHPGPDRHRGHRVQHRPRPARLDPGNYPERLSYSATPPDFGSLVVSAGAGPTAAC